MQGDRKSSQHIIGRRPLAACDGCTMFGACHRCCACGSRMKQVYLVVTLAQFTLLQDFPVLLLQIACYCVLLCLL